MNITYRKLGATDSKRYREIRLESLRLHPESFGSTFEEQSKLPKLWLEKALEAPVDDRFVVGALDRQVMIGICAFTPLGPDNEYNLSNAGAITQVYVKSAYSGRKIGLGLIKAVIAGAFKIRGIEQIVLEVKEGNISAIRVYEQAGFQIYRAEGGEPFLTEDGTRVMIFRGED